MNNPFPPKTGKQDTAQARNARAQRPEAQTEQWRVSRLETPPRRAFSSLTDEDIQRAEWEGMTSNKPCRRLEDDYIPRSSPPSRE